MSVKSTEKSTVPISEQEQDDLIYEPSAYQTSRGLVFGIIALVCFLIGIGGGLFYTWQISPIVEQNTRPDQLRIEDQTKYVVAIGLDYAHTGDLNRAYQLLSEVDPERDPFQIAADTVCRMIRSEELRTQADIEAIRNLISIYRSQPNVTENCNTEIVSTSPPPTIVVAPPSPSPSPTISPVETKTPTPPLSSPATSAVVASPIATVFEGEFDLIQSFALGCNPDNSGIIEIYVREANTGNGIPGVEVTVFWNTSTQAVDQSFYTGLKPNRGDGYADFQMQQGVIYQVSLPGRSGRSDRLEADVCDDEGTLRSYSLIFQSQ